MVYCIDVTNPDREIGPTDGRNCKSLPRSFVPNIKPCTSVREVISFSDNIARGVSIMAHNGIGLVAVAVVVVFAMEIDVVVSESQLLRRDCSRR